MSIGENIKLYRTKLGLTQKQLAENCSLSESAIKYYESNRRKPKIETLGKIADALDIDLWDIIGEDSNLEIDLPKKEIDPYKDKMDKVFFKMEKEKAIKEWIKTTNLYEILTNVLEKNYELNDLRNNLDTLSDLEINEFKELNNIPINDYRMEGNIVGHKYKSNYINNMLTKIIMIFELEKNNLDFAIKNKKK